MPGKAICSNAFFSTKSLFHQSKDINRLRLLKTVIEIKTRVVFPLFYAFSLQIPRAFSLTGDEIEPLTSLITSDILKLHKIKRATLLHFCILILSNSQLKF